MRRFLSLSLSFIVFSILVPGLGHAKSGRKFYARKYLSETEALKLQKESKSDRIKTETIRLDDSTMNRIRKKQRVNFYTDTFELFRIYQQGDSKPYRYAIHIKQPGQHKYMDLMYGVNKDGTIHRIDLMIYREPYGGEVKSRRFMKQFEGESLSSSRFRVNLDVIHVSGATISSKSVARGTRKILAILKHKNYIP